MAVSYKDLGLSNSKEIFAKALEGGYAIPGFNFNNMEQIQAIVIACLEYQSPVILQVSSGARQYADETLLRYMAMGAVEMMKRMAKEKGLKEIPMVLHLDHGESFEICKACIDSGFSSVMYDGSHHPLEENIRISKQVVEYAHARDVSVECELGRLQGIEDKVKSDKSIYTDPDEAVRFIKETGCDSLAISIGTSHGAYKFKVEKAEDIPPLREDILDEIIKKLGKPFPIVLHGASSVNVVNEQGEQYVEIINKYGGKLEKAFGVPEEQISRIVKKPVTKVNIDSDNRLVITAMIRKIFAEKPKEFDPRKYLGPAREELVKMYKHKIEVLGSKNKA
jgi:fructose-bisphosphate aldolase class II